MNAKIIFTLSILLVSFALISSQKTKAQCVATFESWGCQSGTAKCHALCENRDYVGPCTEDCRDACVCKTGYLRNGENGECIKTGECP